MATLTINKTGKVDVKGQQFEVGKTYVTKFQQQDIDNVLYIPAFDDAKCFAGWATISPAPKTIDDIAGLGYDLFASAMSGLSVKIQAKIKSKGDGKRAIDERLASLTRDLVAGRITMEELTRQVNEIQGNSVVQI